MPEIQGLQGIKGLKGITMKKITKLQKQNYKNFMKGVGGVRSMRTLFRFMQKLHKNLITMVRRHPPCEKLWLIILNLLKIKKLNYIAT